MLPNQVDKNIFFFRFVDIALAITRALTFPKLVLKNANTIVKSMYGTRHDEQRLLSAALRHKPRHSEVENRTT